MAKKKSQNKLIKFVAAAAGIILVGCSIAWYAGVQKIKEIDTKAIEYLENKGFKVERTEPSYSGFPLKITQKRDRFKATQVKNDIPFSYEGKNITASAWIFNPTQIQFKGDITLTMQKGKKGPVQLTAGEGSIELTLDKDGRLVQKAWSVNNLSLRTPDFDDAGIKVKEISSESESDAKGSNTELKSEFEIKGIEIATKAKPIVIDKFKLKGKVVSKFKSYEDLSNAISNLDDDLSKKINENCAAKTGHLPPVGNLIKELEESKAKASGEVEIRIGKFKLEMDAEIKVEDGFPVYEAKLVLDDYDQMTKEMVESGTLDASSEQIARLSLSAIADRDATEGDYVVKTSLKDRKLMLGKNKVMEFKEVDWNTLPVPDDFCQKYSDRLNRSKGLTLQGLSPYISYPVF